MLLLLMSEWGSLEGVRVFDGQRTVDAPAKAAVICRSIVCLRAKKLRPPTRNIKQNFPHSCWFSPCWPSFSKAKPRRNGVSGCSGILNYWVVYDGERSKRLLGKHAHTQTDRASIFLCTLDGAVWKNENRARATSRCARITAIFFIVRCASYTSALAPSGFLPFPPTLLYFHR